MKPFITSKSLEPFNVGFVLDEGLASGKSIIIISGLVSPEQGPTEAYTTYTNYGGPGLKGARRAFQLL